MSMKTLIVGNGYKGFTDLIDDMIDENIIVTNESKQVSSCLRVNIVRIIGVESNAKTVSEFIDNVKSGIDIIDHIPIGFLCSCGESLESLAEKLAKDTSYETFRLTDDELHSGRYFESEPQYVAPNAQFVPKHIAHRKRFSNRPIRYKN